MPSRESLKTTRALYHAAAARQEAGEASRAAGQLAGLVAETAAAVAIVLARTRSNAAPAFGGFPRTPETSGPRSSSLRSVDLIVGTSRPVLDENPRRAGFVLRNAGPGVAVLAFATECSEDLHTVTLQPEGEYPDPTGWAGAVSGISRGAAARVIVTELLL